jgi:uncharacterized protein (DUF1501 family)
MNHPILVVASLRGGLDALNALIPHGDSDYYRLRPTLAVPPPKKAKQSVIDLDGFFGLHPALVPLLPLYERGELAVVHSVGWPGVSHSHFQAWEEIECGAVGGDRPQSGWLARALALQQDAPDSALPAVAFAETMPRLLSGALGGTVLHALTDYRLEVENGRRRSVQKALRLLHERTAFPVGTSGLRTLDALETLGRLEEPPRKGPAPLPGSFAGQLLDVARLIRADIGLRAACVELGGWDLHFAEGSTAGAMPRLLDELARGVAAFRDEIGDDWKRVVLVAISEFGRRAGENGSGGTDHGQAGLILVAGGAVRGGRLLGDWPGLAGARLSPPGDLAITTDFREVLHALLPADTSEEGRARVFPGYRRHRHLDLLQCRTS